MQGCREGGREGGREEGREGKEGWRNMHFQVDLPFHLASQASE